MKRNTLIVLLSFFITLGVYAQNAPTPRVLYPGSTKLLTVPPFAFYDEPRCDSDGNLFFHLDTGRYRDADVFKLSRSGEQGYFYRLTPELADKVVYNSFAVSPSGKLYVLGDAADGLYLISFKTDGALNNSIRLETPENLHATHFGVFDDGAALVTGYYNRFAPEALKGKNYAAIIQPSGKLSTVLAGDFGKTDFEDTSKLVEGAISVGNDGKAYFLRATEVRVISESGESHRIPFKKPDAQMTATRLNVSNGLLAIVLMTFKKEKHTVNRKYLVMYSSTGDVMGLYEPSAELGGEDVCFSQEDGFTFLRTDSAKRTEKIIAPLR